MIILLILLCLFVDIWFEFFEIFWCLFDDYLFLIILIIWCYLMCMPAAGRSTSFTSESLCTTHGTGAHLGDGPLMAACPHGPWAYSTLWAATGATHHSQLLPSLSCLFQPVELFAPLSQQCFSARGSRPSRHETSDCNLCPAYVSRLLCLCVFHPCALRDAIVDSDLK